MTLGQRMREARRRAGETNDGVFAGEMGITVATLWAWEADIEEPTQEQLARFAELVGEDAAAFAGAVASEMPQGICRAIDLVPDREQAEVLEEVGLPPELHASAEAWIAFLRLARAAARMSPEAISTLAENAEACVIDAGRTRA
ncbi:MAG: helix-turn-helix transcriptional regulator [candidate division WS1 bacterium]|jgi:transcriptional regulator with XRE-family HTH domain|nr:helix-turn-helix transcriptional regulator [candidate division WS1 bacterium]